MKIALSCNPAWGSGGQGASLAHAAGALSDTGALQVYRNCWASCGLRKKHYAHHETY